MGKQQRKIEEFDRMRLGKPETVSTHTRMYDIKPQLDKKTKDKIKKGKAKMLKGEFIDSFKDKTKKKKKTGQTNLDKQLDINTKVLEEYGDLKTFDKHQKRFKKISPDEIDIKSPSPKDAYIEYMMKSTKEQLYRTAKAYKIKGISKMRKEQLVKAIIVDEKKNIQKDTPYFIKPNENEYYTDRLALKKLWNKYYDEGTGLRDGYFKATKEYWKKKRKIKKDNYPKLSRK